MNGHHGRALCRQQFNLYRSIEAAVLRVADADTEVASRLDCRCRWANAPDTKVNDRTGDYQGAKHEFLLQTDEPA